MAAWLRERRPTSQAQLFSFVKELRRFGHHSRALLLFDWMARRGMPLSPGAHAVRLDLLARAAGAPEAHRYFSSLPPHPKTHGAMLAAFVHCRMEPQSLSLFACMRRLGFLSSPLPYNQLMSLHLSLDQPRKVPDLFRHMLSADAISPDSYSYSMLARSYALLRDPDSFDRVVAEASAAPPSGFEPDWNLHATFAFVYISLGKLEQAESQLRSLEEKMNKADRNPYHFLITHYAGIILSPSLPPRASEPL